MLYCSDPKFVGYFPPKTGSASILHALRKKFNCSLRDGQHGIDDANPDWEQTHHHFITVRWIFPRAVSWWWYLRTKVFKRWPSQLRKTKHEIVRNQTFKQFCTDSFTRSLLKPCANWFEAMPRVDTILHTESLSADFTALPFIDQTKLPKRNVGQSAYGDWREYYNTKCVCLIRDQLGKDCDLFDYPTDPF